MPRILLPLIISLLLITGPAHAAEHRVIKVLPHLLDQEGRHTRSPGLFERDAYQAWLRANPGEQSGIRYDVQWRSQTPGDYILKLELIGRVEQGRVNRRTIESKVTSRRRLSRWTGVTFDGEDFRQFGPIVAWRVSLWQGDTLLAKHQSFLWE